MWKRQERNKSERALKRDEITRAEHNDVKGCRLWVGARGGEWC